MLKHSAKCTTYNGQYNTLLLSEASDTKYLAMTDKHIIRISCINEWFVGVAYIFCPMVEFS